MTVKCDEIKKLMDDVYGNGKQGMYKKVSEMHDYLVGLKAVIKFAKWVLGFIGITNIILIAKALLK